MRKNFFAIIMVLMCVLFVSCGDDKKEKSEEIEKSTKVEEGVETRVTKNQKTGEYVVQVLVKDNADHDEIYKTLMDAQTQVHKDFLDDDTMVVAYSDPEFMYKDLKGIYGQFKLKKGITEYIKIYPRENVSEEDKKNALEYINLFNGLISVGESEDNAKKETHELIKARHPEDYAEIISRAEEYLFGIEKVKTEEEKLLNPVIDYKANNEKPSYAQVRLIPMFEDFLQNEGKKIKDKDKQIRKFLEKEKVDLTVQEFKDLEKRVLEWEKNRKE